MSRGENYVTVKLVYRQRTEKAVLLQYGQRRAEWVPRSTLHAASDDKLKTVARGDEVELKIMEWVVKSKGLN